MSSSQFRWVRGTLDNGTEIVRLCGPDLVFSVEGYVFKSRGPGWCSSTRNDSLYRKHPRERSAMNYVWKCVLAADAARRLGGQV